MPLVKLKEISQDTWLRSGGGPSRDGVCYYMCNFLESNLGIWSKSTDFREAKQKAADFHEGTAMMNYAKSQNIQHKGQRSYQPLPNATFNGNSLYRVGVCIKRPQDTHTTPNHEIILVTGPNHEVIFFEPNFGFYEITNPTANNAPVFEAAIASLYTPLNLHTISFEYQRVRSITQSTPLGFPQ